MAIRAAVVGGGLAGLAAANQLVDRGIDVTLYERRAETGGRAATTTHDTYRFNQGPHALYLGGAGNAVLTDLGIDVGRDIGAHVPTLKGAKALYRGELYTLPSGPAGLVSTGLLGARAKLAFGRLLARLPKVATEPLVGTTVEDWVDEVAVDEASTQLLEALIRLSTYANSADLQCAGAAVEQLKLAVDPGVVYLDGGWGSLVEQLQARAVERGLLVKQEGVESVDELLTDNDRVVLAVGSPTATNALLGSAAEPQLVDRAGPPVEAAVLEVGTTTIPDRSFILGIDLPLYASVHSPPADLAPAGHSVICAARYLAPGEEHDATATKAELEGLIGRLGVDDAHIATERYLHRMPVTHGLPMASLGGLAGRPGVAVPGRPEVAVAGDWVGDRGLLADASLASGVAAASRVLEAP